MNPPTIAATLAAALAGLLAANTEARAPTPQELADASDAATQYDLTRGWSPTTTTAPDTELPGSVLAVNSFGKVQMAPAIVVADDAVAFPLWQPLPELPPA